MVAVISFISDNCRETRSITFCCERDAAEDLLVRKNRRRYFIMNAESKNVMRTPYGLKCKCERRNKCSGAGKQGAIVLLRPDSAYLVILEHFEKIAIKMHARGGGFVLFPVKTHKFI